MSCAYKYLLMKREFLDFKGNINCKFIVPMITQLKKESGVKEKKGSEETGLRGVICNENTEKLYVLHIFFPLHSEMDSGLTDYTRSSNKFLFEYKSKLF